MHKVSQVLQQSMSVRQYQVGPIRGRDGKSFANQSASIDESVDDDDPWEYEVEPAPVSIPTSFSAFIDPATRKIMERDDEEAYKYCAGKVRLLMVERMAVHLLKYKPST